MRMRCGVTCDGNRTAAAVAAVLPSPSGDACLTDETLRAVRCMFVQHVYYHMSLIPYSSILL